MGKRCRRAGKVQVIYALSLDYRLPSPAAKACALVQSYLLASFEDTLFRKLECVQIYSLYLRGAGSFALICTELWICFQLTYRI